MAQFLMSPATYFRVEYIINPWMEKQIGKVKSELALEQWQNLYKTIQQYAEVKLVEPEQHVPDLVFTANAGSVKNNRVIVSHFHHPERQAEEPIFKKWFADNHFELIDLPENMEFEGAGDALFQPETDRLWLGHGFRSDIRIAAFLEKTFHANVIPLKLVDPYFYHLDTCFCPLSNGYVMYNPHAFDAQSNHVIEETVVKEKRIKVNTDDAKLFACNAVTIEDAKNGPVIIMNSASAELQKILQNIGYQVVLTSTSEFLRAGGATKCLSLQIDI